MIFIVVGVAHSRSGGFYLFITIIAFGKSPALSFYTGSLSRGVAWDGKATELNKLTGTELCLLRGKTTTVKFLWTK